MILTVTALHITQTQTLSPVVGMSAVWTPVAQITPALPMDSVIRLPRRVLMPSNPDLNDPVCT